jgi:membrane-associated phospholipid phosphatase
LDRASCNGSNRVDRRLSSRSSDRELDHDTFLTRIETSDANREQRWGIGRPHAIAGAIGFAIAFVMGSKAWMRIFLAMLIALALAGVTTRAIKIATGRARPSVKTEAQWNGPQFRSKFHAFPSGHTTSSTAFFVALFLARKKIGAPLLLIPVLIAISRLIVGAHYLSDVTFAAILGVICALLVAHWLSIRNPKSQIRN